MNGLYTIYESDGNGRKNPKEKVKIEQNKNRFVFSPIPPSIKRRPTFFLISEGTENKPDFLSGEGRLS